MNSNKDKGSDLKPSTLKNSYYIMRHGRSLANEQRLIVSSPSNGLTGYGLTPEGRDQIRRSLSSQSLLNHETLIIASDFLRTRESGALAAEILKTAPIRTCEELRERNFGDFELSSDENYPRVWASDKDNNDNEKHGVESPGQVQRRFRRCLARLEADYTGRTILLVSHGDLLQIAQTWSEGKKPCRHRSLNHLETAEIRGLSPRI